MWWAARAEDGRGPGTALADALPAHFGLPSMLALIEAVHLGHLTPEQRVEMTPLLFDVAADGTASPPTSYDARPRRSPPSRVAALTRLELLDEPTPVVLGGGVLTAGHRMLLDGIDEVLATSAPKAFTRVVTTPLVVGAGLLGLDHVSAPDSTKERLREGLAPTGGALMEVVICPDSGVAAVLVADAIERLLRGKPDAVLGLATGSSPLGVYDELARRVQDGTLSLRRARAFLLDEYVGLPAGTTRATDR